MDSRFENKRKMIFDGLTSFLQIHEEKELNISLLCLFSKIQRHCFYNHYENLLQLYDDYSKDLMETIEKDIHLKSPASVTMEEKIQAFLDVIEKNKQRMNAYYRILKYEFSRARFYALEKASLIQDSGYSFENQIQEKFVMAGINAVIHNFFFCQKD